jgi:hypothetical protein
MQFALERCDAIAADAITCETAWCSAMPASWGSKASPSVRTRTAAPGEAADWLKSRTRTCAAVKREAEEDLGR